MIKNYVKIDKDNYSMTSEPEENSKSMKKQGYTKVTDSQFDGIFNLYEAVQSEVISYRDVLRILNKDR